MDKQIIGKINFNSYLVDTLRFEINTDFVATENIELELSFNRNIVIDPDNHNAVIRLACTIYDNYKEKNYPFYIFVQIRAIFKYESEMSLEETKNMLETNGIAIVFPYLRSIISVVTANAGLPPLIIPTINIIEMLKTQNK